VTNGKNHLFRAHHTRIDIADRARSLLSQKSKLWLHNYSNFMHFNVE